MEALRRLKNKALESARMDYGYFFRNGSMALMQNIAGLAFSVMSSVILVAALPVVTYGNYAYIAALIGLCSACTLSGMNTAVARAAARGQEYALDAAIRIQVKWCAALLIPLGAYALYLHGTGSNGSFVGAFAIAGISFLITTALSPAGAFLFGRGEFKRLAYYGAVFNGITLVMLGATAWHTDSLVAIASAYGIGSISNATCLYFRARAIKKDMRRSSEKDDGDLFRFGGHLSIINAFSIAAEYADKIILFHFLGPIQLAMYSMASNIMDTGKAAIRSVVSVSLPKLSTIAIGEIRRDLIRHVVWGMGMGIILCLVYWIIIPPAIGELFPKYLPSIPYAQMLGISFIFMIPITYIAYVFHSQKMIAMLYVNGVVPNIMRIACYATAGIYWGIGGIVISRIALYALTLCINSISMFAAKEE